MKIAVIGSGGAGLTTAWLLEEQHQVTVFEQLDRLGGHACTVQVERAGEINTIDAGFEMFSDRAFPLFNRLLSLLAVAVQSFPMTLTLEQSAPQRISLVPPIRAGKLTWSALTPRSLWELAQFRYVLGRAGPIVQARDPFLTLDQFFQRLRLSRAFRERFLYPFLQSGWCLPLEEFLRFSAYDVLKLMTLHRAAGLSGIHWNEVVGGTQTYIRTLARALTHAQIRLSTPIYQITREGDRLALLNGHGQRETFDHVILATNAVDASRLLTTLDGSEELCHRLDKVEYFETRIAIHGDRRWMPTRQQHWSVVNIRAEGKLSAVTIWKPWHGRDLFRSWVTYSPTLPEPLYALLTFQHPKPNHSYFETQAYLETVQGQQNLWFAGMHTQDVDLHESAILSAVRVAQRLAPGSARLQQLLEAPG